MRDPKRMKIILTELEKVWNKVPDQRLGQLIKNITYSKDGDNLFYIEDDIMLKLIKEYLNVD